MSSIEMVSHHLEIYTATQCWRGDVTMPSMRRLADFFNDPMHEFITMTGASLLVLEKGTLLEKTTYASIALRIQSISAVTRNIDPSPGRADALQRVQKQPFPILLYAPPYTLEGKLHLLSGGQMFETIDAARQSFFALTAGMISIDRQPLLPTLAELLVVNKHWVTAFRAVS